VTSQRLTAWLARAEDGRAVVELVLQLRLDPDRTQRVAAELDRAGDTARRLNQPGAER
jgi:hypothetical protein